jgi:peptidoglycan/LPS O-acetylase OafA/YrhL
MGLLRTLFAISVVFDHSPFNNGEVLVGGRLAVQLFYVISGFLISYILNTDTAYRNLGTFYKNRALRLYPTYFAVALIALFVDAQWDPTFLQVYREIPASAAAFLVAANALLFGQDWVMFAGVKHAALVFTGSFMDSDVPLYEGLLVPQAWTLGVELSFYLVAPFIVRSLKRVVVLFLASLCLRVALIMHGVGMSDPWSYRFFPMELALFLAGTLSHQLLLPLYKRWVQRLPRLPEVAVWLFVAYTMLHFSVNLQHNLRDGLAILGFIAILPLAFIYQGRHKLDRRIGALSYPIYISHGLAIVAAGFLAMELEVRNTLAISLMNVGITIVMAWGFYYAIDARIEKIRQRVKNGSGSDASVRRAARA